MNFGMNVMKQTRRVLLAGLMAMATLTFGAGAASAAEDVSKLGPQELVNKVANDTLKDLDANRAE